MQEDYTAYNLVCIHNSLQTVRNCKKRDALVKLSTQRLLDNGVRCVVYIRIQ